MKPPIDWFRAIVIVTAGALAVYLFVALGDGW